MGNPGPESVAGTFSFGFYSKTILFLTLFGNGFFFGGGKTNVFFSLFSLLVFIYTMNTVKPMVFSLLSNPDPEAVAKTFSFGFYSKTNFFLLPYTRPKFFCGKTSGFFTFFNFSLQSSFT